MSWILNKNRFWKIITKHANKCSVIFSSLLNTLYDWNQFSAQIIWLLMLMFLTGKFRNLLDFVKRERSAWKIWHCSLFLLLAYNVLTEKKEKENKILGKKTKSFLLHCLLWVRFKRKNRRKKNFFCIFFALFNHRYFSYYAICKLWLRLL